MTHPRTRAYRALGTCQNHIPHFVVVGLVNTIAKEIEGAAAEVMDASQYRDSELASALIECLALLKDEERDAEAARLACKSRLIPLFRHIGK